MINFIHECHQSTLLSQQYHHVQNWTWSKLFLDTLHSKYFQYSVVKRLKPNTVLWLHYLFIFYCVFKINRYFKIWNKLTVWCSKIYVFMREKKKNETLLMKDNETNKKNIDLMLMTLTYIIELCVPVGHSFYYIRIGKS